MKKKLFSILTVVILILCVALFLNMETTTRQGIDFDVREVKIPMYLKILNFIDRHYSYKDLAGRITAGRGSPEDRIMAIFSWTHENIRKQPEGLPVVDDHVWNIIIRGYGISDQAADVFSTLCNYTRLSAFYDYISPSVNDSYGKILICYVKSGKSWHFFDPYNGIYFINNDGRLATANDLEAGNWQLSQIGVSKEDRIPDHEKYISNIVKVRSCGLRRENMQSPVRRIIFGLKNKR